MLQASESPLLCPSPAVCSPVVWKWYAKHGLAAKEFSDTTLLVTFMGGPYGIHTVKPVKTLDELKALKIRAAGPSLPMAKALGLNAVPLRF
jgi:TRAP-type C4-dicarboxylate transport system substrate-binding protein